MVKCSVCECGRLSILLREICPSCRKRMMVEDIGNKGKILTFTTLYSAPEGFTTPINIAMVELENGARLLCEARCEMRIGKEVKIEEEGEKYFCID